MPRVGGAALQTKVGAGSNNGSLYRNVLLYCVRVLSTVANVLPNAASKGTHKLRVLSTPRPIALRIRLGKCWLASAKLKRGEDDAGVVHRADGRFTGMPGARPSVLNNHTIY